MVLEGVPSKDGSSGSARTLQITRLWFRIQNTLIQVLLNLTRTKDINNIKYQRCN